jgi:hypothetical protein
MPAALARLVDMGTAPMPERIAAVEGLRGTGHEVRLDVNLMIVPEGRLDRWCELFHAVDAAILLASRAQLVAEVILLT